MNIYWDKLAYVQVVTNCQYFVAPMCTWEEYSPAFLDDVISQSDLTTIELPNSEQLNPKNRISLSSKVLIFYGMRFGSHRLIHPLTRNNNFVYPSDAQKC